MTKHLCCTECGQPIILRPSAEQRAIKDMTGRTAMDYRNLFTIHSDCQIKKRNRETIELIRRINGKQELDFAPEVK